MRRSGAGAARLRRRGPLGNDDGRARLGHSSHTVAQYGNGCRHSQDAGEKPGNTLTGMDHYAPLPTVEQLEALGRELGQTTRFDRRIVGGLGGTVDVLIVGTDPGESVVLKRYWLPEPGEISPAESEFRALALAADRGIRAPSPIWIDRIGLFPERAIVISFRRRRRASGPRRSDRLGRPTGVHPHRDPPDRARARRCRPSSRYWGTPTVTSQKRRPWPRCGSTRWAWSSGQDVSRSCLPEARGSGLCPP